MLTIPEVVEKIVLNTFFLEEGLSRDIINHSALAREIKPEIESTLMKEVHLGAIIMALRRLSIHLKKNSIQKKINLLKIGDLTVRSNLVEYTYLNSDSIIEKQKQLIEILGEKKGSFITFTHGVFETNLIISENTKQDIEMIFKDEKQISKIDKLSAITIKLPKEAVYTPGVHYYILKQLAWGGINVVEEVSTYTEFTIILENDKVDQAFSILKNSLML